MLDRNSLAAALLGAIAASLALAPGAFAQSGPQASAGPQTPVISATASANDRLTPLGPEGTALAKRVGVGT